MRSIRRTSDGLQGPPIQLEPEGARRDVASSIEPAVESRPSIDANLSSLLTTVAERHPSRTALVSFNGRESSSIAFSVLEERSAQLALELHAAGLAHGDSVILLTQPRMETFAAIAAVLRVGCRVTVIEPRLGLRGMNRAAATIGAKGILVGGPGRVIARALPELRRIPLRWGVGNWRDWSDSTARLPINGAGDHAQGGRPAVAVHPESAAVVTFTGGGSSGAPRVVARSHAVLAAQHDALRRALPTDRNDIDLPGFPMLVLHNLASGIPSALWSQPFAASPPPNAFADLIEQLGVTTASGTPAFWARLARAWVQQGRHVDLRRIAIGGAPVTSGLVSALRRVAPNAEVVGVYGTTEAEPIALLPASRDLSAIAAGERSGAGFALGDPVPDAQVRLLAADGVFLNDDAVGVVGEVTVTGAHVATGAEEPVAEGVRGLEADGPLWRRTSDRWLDADGVRWLRTGDLAYRDRNGRLWQVDRLEIPGSEPSRRAPPSGIRRAAMERAHAEPAAMERAHNEPAAMERAHAEPAAMERAHAEPAAMERARVEAAIRCEPWVTGAALVSRPRIDASTTDAEEQVLVVEPTQPRNPPRDWHERTLAAWQRAVPSAKPGVAQIGRIEVDRRHRSRVDHRAMQRSVRRQQLPRYLWSYLAERFPLSSYLPLIAVFFSANYLLSLVATDAGPPTASWRWLAGSVILLAMFFHLRVIDEHKDSSRDRWVHPDRLLSRGIVTLGHLRALGVAAVAIELSLAAALGTATVIATLLVIGISGLIARDFFAPGWLESRMLTNAVVHMSIMPFFSLLAYSVAVGLPPWTAPPAVLVYAGVSYGVGFGYEVARKVRAPEDERPGLVTYSSALGHRATALVFAVSLLAASAISVWVGVQLGFGDWYHAVVASLLLVVVAGAIHYGRRPTRSAAARLERLAGLYIFVLDALVAFEILRLNFVLR